MARLQMKSKVTHIKALTGELRKSRKIIARERDRLRALQDDLEDLADDLDEGLRALDEAIEVFSHKQ